MAVEWVKSGPGDGRKGPVAPAGMTEIWGERESDKEKAGGAKPPLQSGGR